MSQQKRAAPGAESNTFQNGTRIGDSSRHTPILPPIISRYESPRGNEPYRPPTMGGLPNPTPPPPPLRTNTSAPSPDSPDPASLRTLKMHNILNPTSAAEEQSRSRPALQLETPQTTSASSSRYPSESSTEPLSYGGNSSYSSMSIHPLGLNQGSLQALNASPSANRAPPLQSVNPPSATIDAKRSPFLSSNGHAYSPDTGAKYVSNYNGSTPPVASRSSYGFSLQQTVTPPDRRPGEPVSQIPPSQSNSPSTSYSSYSHPSHTSPASQFIVPVSQSSSGPYFGSMHVTTSGRTPTIGPTITLGSESSFGSTTSAVGQSTYQLMTLDTDQGPIQVPVDVQAASKMADEKRKRNAGASARFRQRRKEKEREASQTIAKLESQLREIGDEREYYRAERDYFRGLIYSTGAQNHVQPRPPSPRQRGSALTIGNRSDAQWQGPEERGGQTGRNTRRRISSYNSAYELAPPAVAGQNQPAGFAPSPPVSISNLDNQAQTSLHRPQLPPTGSSHSGSFDSATHSPFERKWKPN